MLETDLISVRLRLRQESDFCAIHHFDIPCHASDQRGYVDGASARNHLLPMSKHAPDGREAKLVRLSIQTLQLRQASEAKVYARMHDHGEPLGKETQSRIMNGDYAVLATHRFIRDYTPPRTTVKNASFIKTQCDTELF